MCRSYLEKYVKEELQKKGKYKNKRWVVQKDLIKRAAHHPLSISTYVIAAAGHPWGQMNRDILLSFFFV